MSTLDRLLTNVRRSFGAGKRIWLTEYGYQTSPPDHTLGVSYATQARFVSEGALRALLAPRVDVLIHYLVRDEPETARWQSGLLTTREIAKPSYNAFRFPLAQRSRRGRHTVLAGQVRPGGRAGYRLLRFASGTWNAVGGTSHTTTRGFFTRTVNAAPGTRFRVWIPAARTYSAIVTVR
jgi:hypothetical protein